MKKSFRIRYALLVVAILGFSILCLSSCRNSGNPLAQVDAVTQSGLASEEEVSVGHTSINLCIDLFSSPSRDMSSFIEQIIARNPNIQVNSTEVPKTEPERSNYLTRIRTEIMAGKGPDVFICQCPNSSSQGVFKYPKQAMNNHVFLCLDNYISQAKHMDLESLLPILVNVGKTDEGQQLLPVTYEFRMILSERENGPLKFDCPMTWSEMIDSDIPIIQSAVNYGFINDVFGELGDYSSDTPTFSESDFFNICYAKKEFIAKIESNYPQEGLPVYMSDGWLTCADESSSIVCVNFMNKDNLFYFLPAYNTTGGITANICTFAAVNRNTEYPNESFAIIDYLLSKEAQKNDNIYLHMLGLPTDIEIGSKDEPLHNRYMNESNFQEFTAVRDQINEVKFYTPLDTVFSDTLAIWYKSANTDENLKKVVHDQYMKMQMMLAES